MKEEIQNVEIIGIPTETNCLEAIFTQQKQSYTAKYHRVSNQKWVPVKLGKEHKYLWIPNSAMPKVKNLFFSPNRSCKIEFNPFRSNLTLSLALVAQTKSACEMHVQNCRRAHLFYNVAFKMAPCSVHKELYNAPLFVCLISEISSYEQR